MTISRSEDVLVGLITLALVPWIGWTVARGLRSNRLPIGRNYVDRLERPAPFALLLTLYAAAAVMAVYISLDLLFEIRLKDLL
jgi:hypothetical protein